jgi:hypothetical protein
MSCCSLKPVQLHEFKELAVPFLALAKMLLERIPVQVAYAVPQVLASLITGQ